MEENYTFLVDKLEDKISKLVDRYRHLKNEVSVLTTKNEKLSNDLLEAKNKMLVLEENYNTLKVSKVLETTGSDINGTKLKINELVREIDKCIALLNR